MIKFLTLRAASMGAVLLLGATSALASPVAYLFNGTADSGAFAGESYRGQFSFDDAGLTLTGFESLALSALVVGFHGANFGLADAAAAPTVNFQDGVFLGLSYTVEAFDPAFSLVSGLSDTSEAYFAYTPSDGGAGYGGVSYTPVPLPGAAILLCSGLAGLWGYWGRKSAA